MKAHSKTKCKFKFGDKVHTAWAGNAIFHSRKVLDAQFPIWDAILMVPSQTELLSDALPAVKKGWVKK